MANYVALTTVTNKLPSGYDNDVSDSRIQNTLIVEASNEVDELAGFGFPRIYNSNAQKFPEINDTPTTPATISLCALWLTLSRVYEEMGDKSNRGDEENEVPNKTYYRRLAINKMKDVRDGKVDLSVEANETIATQSKYFDSDVETDMDHKLKMNEMDTLYP